MSERRKPPLLLRPRFVLFVLYIALYVLLRMSGIVEARVLKESAGIPYFQPAVVAPNQGKPRWQRQTLRAAFSLPMVLEEEARLAVERAQSLATQKVEEEYRKATEKSEEMLRDALQKQAEEYARPRGEKPGGR